MRAALLPLLLPTLFGPATPIATPSAPARPLARLYVYTTPDVRPRHRDIVARAIELRAKTHVSGFARADDPRERTPELALGARVRGVSHWRWDAADGTWRATNSASRTWPFVAVLEYTGAGGPTAYVDWFRRPRHSRDGGAWSKDPADQRYARHISAQTAFGHDDRYMYMALCDTPTGDVVASNEWVVRGRVDWEGGGSVRTGWWLWFDTSSRRVEEWEAELRPLVDWIPTRAAGERGGVDYSGSEPLPDRNAQLCVFGARVRFDLPAIPVDVTPGRGR